MRSILALFGLLSAFMLVFAIPLENSVALEKRQAGGSPVDITGLLNEIQGLITQVINSLPSAASGGGTP